MMLFKFYNYSLVNFATTANINRKGRDFAAMKIQLEIYRTCKCRIMMGTLDASSKRELERHHSDID